MERRPRQRPALRRRRRRRPPRGQRLLHRRAGDDVIHGGDGDDTVQGDADNDVLYGEAGDDRQRRSVLAPSAARRQGRDGCWPSGLVIDAMRVPRCATTGDEEHRTCVQRWRNALARRVQRVTLAPIRPYDGSRDLQVSMRITRVSRAMPNRALWPSLRSCMAGQFHDPPAIIKYVGAGSTCDVILRQYGPSAPATGRPSRQPTRLPQTPGDITTRRTTPAFHRSSQQALSRRGRHAQPGSGLPGHAPEVRGPGRSHDSPPWRQRGAAP